MPNKEKGKEPRQSRTYDIPLRKLFRQLPVKFLELLGISVDPEKVKFLDVKLPKLFEREVDLIFEYIRKGNNSDSEKIVWRYFPRQIFRFAKDFKNPESFNEYWRVKSQAKKLKEPVLWLVLSWNYGEYVFGKTRFQYF